MGSERSGKVTWLIVELTQFRMGPLGFKGVAVISQRQFIMCSGSPQVVQLFLNLFAEIPYTGMLPKSLESIRAHIRF